MKTMSHEANLPYVHYYEKGYVKSYLGHFWLREDQTYILDFYDDGVELVSLENRCSEEEALQQFIKIYGTSDGFYTVTI